MTEGSLWDKILKYALPLAATGILQQLFNAADIAVVGRLTGEYGATAMAAVGANTPIIGLAVMSVIGISLGTNVVIANAVGRGDEKSVKKTVHTSILIAVIFGVVMAALGLLLADAIFSTQKLPDEVFPLAVRYFRIYFSGAPVIILYNFESAIFRGVGDTRTPLFVLVISGIINVILNVFFVVVMHMTVEGVAIATVLSNLISCMLLLIKMLRTDTIIRVEFKSLSIDGPILGKILRIGIPAGLQAGVFNFANILIQTAINSLGTTIMAASSAAFNLEVFVYNGINSFSQANTTFVGQNFGAGKIDRCKRAALISFGEGICFMIMAVTLVLLFGHQMLSIFNTDPEVIKYGYIRLLLIFSAYTFTLIYENASGYMRGFGISVMPAILTMIGVCGVRITWIYAVFPRFKTFNNIMLVYPISLATTALLMVIWLLIVKPSKKFKGV